MDINTKTLQHQAAAITPLRPDNVKKPVESLVKSAADAAQKTEVQSVSADIAIADKAKVAADSDDLKQAVSQLNDFVQSMQRNLQFSIDKESGTMVVKKPSGSLAVSPNKAAMTWHLIFLTQERRSG
jgi:uncharacterized FlaG/YvyC family protein